MIMRELVPVILLLILQGQALEVIKALEHPQGGEDYCLAEDSNPFVLCGSKTPYVFARGENLNPGELVPEGCTPQKVWLLARHGTRYPGNGDILAMQLNLPQLQEKVIQAQQDGTGSLCAEDIVELSKWQLGQINITWNSILAPEGEHELKNLGMSYKALLPELLNLPFDNKTYQFSDTSDTDFKKSAHSLPLVSGLKGNDRDDTTCAAASPSNFILLNKNRCYRYGNCQQQNATTTMANGTFYDGPEMQGVVASVSSRLGFDVSFVDVEVIYDACRYYKAWEPTLPSAWCAAFTPDDLKILEFWQDLKYYYEDGYGHEINYKIACPLVKDLIHHFRSVTEDGDTTKGVFYFSHSEALIKMMTRLGLHHDDTPLTHSSIDPDRLWRSSLHAPFGTNVAFTLSSCSNGGWWVSLAESETPTAIPGCSGGTAGCSWEEFLQVLGPFEDCPFEDMCKLEGCLHSWESISCAVDSIQSSLQSIFASISKLR
ncbi:unnamed protein product [Meganyctiphanes norvegica]|uniref:Multiple inositol polyphosphate phosphatase 1 n=1 Tax=Meganyctiphanes norvegica TaxID=48144 RepID=A0AAV2R564_MEGNR